MDSTTALTQAVAEASVRFDTEFDLQSLGRKLQAAIDSHYPAPDTGWNNVIAIYPDRVVYEVAGEKYEIPFTLTNEEPTLSTRSKVEVQYVAETKFVTVSESISGNLTASQASQKGYVWDVVILKEGKTLSANCDLSGYGLPGKFGFKNYTAEALRKAVAEKKFDLAPFVVRPEGEHLAFQNGGGKTYGVNEEIHLIGGAFDKTYVAETANGVAIGGKLRLKNSESGRATRDYLMGRVESGAAIPYELSWTGTTECFVKDPDALTPTIEVTAIAEVESVDPVYRGNAGGAILRTSESNLPKHTMNPKDKHLIGALYTSLLALKPKGVNLKAAEAAAGDGGDTAPPDNLDAVVAQLFLDNNPAVAAMFDSADEFAKSPKFLAAVSDWLQKSLKGEAKEDPAGETPMVADAPASESKIDNKIVTALQAQIEEQKKATENMRKMVAESHLNAALIKNSNLPEFMLEELKTSLAGETDTTKIDSAIRSASKLAGMFVSESLSNQTGGRIKFGEDSQDKLRRGVTNFFFGDATDEVAKKAAETLGYNPKAQDNFMFGGIRSMFDSVLGKPLSRHGFGVDNTGKASEAFSADITTQLALDAMYIRFRSEWDTMTYVNDIDKVSSKMTVNDFRTSNIEGLGYFATSGISARTDFTADYGELTLSDAEQAQLAVQDYGNLFYITFKDYINDTVGAVQSIPKRLAQSYALKRYKLMFDLIFGGHTTTWSGTENGVTSTKKVFDATGWGNAFTGATTPAAATISKDLVLSARRGMRKVQQLGSGDVMAIPGKVLVFMSKDADTVYTNTTPAAGQYNTVPTLAQSLGLDPVEVSYWDDDTYDRWFILADPNQGSCFKQIYLAGYETPSITQEAANTGKAFTTDYIRYKIKAPFAVGVDNPRYAFGVKKS